MSSLFARKHNDPLPLFPTYLLPALSFRRKSRQSSTDSDKSTTSSNLTTSSTETTESNNGPATPPPYSSFSSNPFSRSPTPAPAPLLSGPIEPPTDKFLHGATSHIHCAKCSTDLCLTSQIISKGFMGRHGRAYLIQGLPHTPSSRRTSSKTFYSRTRDSQGQELALPNTYLGKAVPRSLVTGQHMVSDINCMICGTLLGWKYVEASEESQKYKVGKFILETKKIRVGVRWDNPDNTPFGNGYGNEDDEIEKAEFDGSRRSSDGGMSKRPANVLPGTAADMPVQTQADIQALSKMRMQQGIGEDGRELEFDSQDEDECEDLFAGVWSPALAARRRQRKSERFRRKAAKVYVPKTSASQESLGY